MQKRYKDLFIIILSVICVVLLVLSFRFKSEANKYISKEILHGTYAIDEKMPIGNQYLVFDENSKVYWYEQSVFYKEGSVQKYGDENVYKLVFEDETMILVHYREELKFIHEDFVQTYTKVSDALQFVGVDE